MHADFTRFTVPPPFGTIYYDRNIRPIIQRGALAKMVYNTTAAVEVLAEIYFLGSFDATLKMDTEGRNPGVKKPEIWELVSLKSGSYIVQLAVLTKDEEKEI